MGTSQFTSQTKRDVFRVYQTLLGVPGDDLPFHYQSFPRVGAAVRILGETRFLWQREEDPSVFTQWEWTDDRPRHTAPGNPLVGTIQAILPSDVGTVVRVLPNAAVIQQGLWAIRRHNPVVGIHPITGKPARQRKDDWLWIHWSSQAFALPRFKTLRNQANQMIPALEMPANGGLLFFLENVEPVETAP